MKILHKYRIVISSRNQQLYRLYSVQLLNILECVSCGLYPHPFSIESQKKKKQNKKKPFPDSMQYEA